MKKGRLEAAEPPRRVSYGLAQTGPLLREAGGSAAAVAAQPAQQAPPPPPPQQQQQQGEHQQGEAERDPRCSSHPHEQQQQQQAAQQAQQPRPLHHPHHPHQAAAGGGSDDATLFSPHFHLLHKEGGAEGHALAAGSPGPSGLATPAPTLCPAVPCRLPGSEGPAEEEEAVVPPPRPHTPPPEAALDCEPASWHAVPLSSPLASPGKPHAAAAAAAADAEAAAARSPAPLPCPSEESEEEEYELEFDPLLFIKRLPPLEQCIPVRRTSFLLPRWAEGGGCGGRGRRLRRQSGGLAVCAAWVTIPGPPRC